MERVQLLCSRRPGWAMLRELCGHDEETVGGAGVLDAVALVDRLLVDAPGAAIATGDAAELAVADRDRVLAAIYVRAFGSRITADLPCAQCGVKFELELELDAVAGELAAQTTRADAGWYRVGDGPRFRLPTATDELAIADLPAGDREAAIQVRCLDDGGGAGAPGPLGTDQLSAEMERCAPLLDIELEARCPSCGHADELGFDVQSYLLQAIVDESARRAVEIHRLATAYGWSMTEILALPRRRRRTFSDLIEAGAA